MRVSHIADIKFPRRFVGMIFSAENVHLAVISFDEPGEAMHRRRLAGAVWADVAEHRSRLQDHVHRPEQKVRVFLDEIFYGTRFRFIESEFGAVVTGEVFGSGIDGLSIESSVFKDGTVLDMEYGYFGIDLPDLGKEFELFMFIRRE